MKRNGRLFFWRFRETGSVPSVLFRFTQSISVKGGLR